MTGSDDLVEAEALELLQELGLTQYEAQTLLNLVQLGTGTAKDITRLGGVPRTRVYEAADRLHTMGFIDVQQSTPRKYTVTSNETLVRMLDVERENTIQQLAENLEELGPVQPQREELGVWTVTGREAVAARVDEFVADADEQVVYMTVDELLTDGHLDRLADAADRGVDIYLAGVSDDVQDRVRESVPSVELFETLWAWRETHAGRLLITDEETALVSAFANGTSDGEPFEETAIWGAGQRNSLVVVLRAIFTWRLEES